VPQASSGSSPPDPRGVARSERRTDRSSKEFEK